MENEKKNLKENDNNKTKSEEKNSSKKKILVSTLIKTIILIIVLIVVVVIARKIIIIKNLQNKVSQYVDLSSYSIRSTTYRGDSISFDECLVNDDRYISITNYIDKENNNKAITFSDEGKVNSYIETNGNKIATLDVEVVAPTKKGVIECLETNSLKEFLYMIFTTRISSEMCDGKECYKIENLKNSNMLYVANSYTTVYVDKDTGLLVRGVSVKLDTEDKDLVVDYDYEFNTITDEDIEEPDISEYKIND